ncbi:MAG: hypothetical protein WCJ14_15180 [Verrucomicrobiota bacterium]
MNRKPLNHDDPRENDAVWKLLDQAPPATAGPRFAERTVRAARLASQAQPWWQRLFAPAPLAGLAAATAALVFSVVNWSGQAAPQSGAPNAQLHATRVAEIQDIAETETLIAAADQLDDFSDRELVSLIGF